MTLYIPPTATDIPDFVRKVAMAVNAMLRGNVFPVSDVPPPDPQPGQSYYDSVTNKAVVWDGTSWQPLW